MFVCRRHLYCVMNELVYVRSYHGRYLCAEPNGTVVADRQVPKEWETWSITKQGDNLILRSFHGKYLCAESNGQMIANRDHAREWEHFLISKNGSNIALRSYHGKFVCAEPDGRVVRTPPFSFRFMLITNYLQVANRDHAKEWETWSVIPAGVEPSCGPQRATVYVGFDPHPPFGIFGSCLAAGDKAITGENRVKHAFIVYKPASGDVYYRVEQQGFYSEGGFLTYRRGVQCTTNTGPLPKDIVAVATVTESVESMTARGDEYCRKHFYLPNFNCRTTADHMICCSPQVSFPFDLAPTNLGQRYYHPSSIVQTVVSKRKEAKHKQPHHPHTGCRKHCKSGHQHHHCSKKQGKPRCQHHHH